MKKLSIASFIAALGLVAASTQAFAGTEVAEYGDPVTGNSYRDCTWTQNYSTGGYGYEYKQYNVVCPASSGIPAINITAGIALNKDPSNPYAATTCTFYVPSGYYTGYNSCTHWRIYLN